MTVQPSTDRRGGVLDSKALRIGVVVALVIAIVVGLLAAVYVANRPADDAVKLFTFPRGLGDTLLFVRSVDLP